MKNKAKNETVFGTVPKCNSKNGGKNIYLYYIYMTDSFQTWHSASKKVAR